MEFRVQEICFEVQDTTGFKASGSEQGVCL